MADRAGPLETVAATRYVTPLREGGSLPGLVEAEDLGIYVAKFRGAGQGPAVLVAEVIVGELARSLGLRTPRLVVLEFSEDLARYEADEEVQDLLKASVGLNLGVDFLPGSFGFTSAYDVDPGLAAKVLWLDAYVANVDRSWRNPNLLVWHDELWLIDHGASLYFQHGWGSGITDPQRFAKQAWDIRDHIFADASAGISAADAELAPLVTPELIDGVLSRVPSVWLEGVPGERTPEQTRAGYRAFLLARIADRGWLPKAAS